MLNDAQPTEPPVREARRNLALWTFAVAVQSNIFYSTSPK